MKIVFISKYPPIEGGVSASAYWLTKGLGEKGIKVDVVTNCWEVENKYRIEMEAEDFKEFMPKNVYVHSTDPFENLVHIPNSDLTIAKLASLAIELVKNNNADLIDSWYLLPYGLAAYIAHTITKKPFILRHAGSDITRLFESPSLNKLLREVFLRAEYIYTIPSEVKKLLEMGVKKERIVFSCGGLINLNIFNPKAEPINLLVNGENNNDIPIITYIGKFGKGKGLFELIDVAKKLKFKGKNFKLLLITKDDNANSLTRYLRDSGMFDKIILMDFVPPWKIPNIMSASSCIISADHDFSVKIHNPRILREAMACGKCILMSREVGVSWPYSELVDMENVIKFNPKSALDFMNKLILVIERHELVKKIGVNARKFSEKIENFNDYITSTELIYKKLTKKNNG